MERETAGELAEERAAPDRRATRAGLGALAAGLVCWALVIWGVGRCFSALASP